MSTPPPWIAVVRRMSAQGSGGQGFWSSSGSTPPTGTPVNPGPINVAGGPPSADQINKLLSGPQRDAYYALQEMFQGYGLGTLAPKIFDYVKNGYGSDTISLLLQDTAEYKQRFAGNEVRRKNGYAVLSPADYLATEQSYRQIMEAAGLPQTFYDHPSDFANWIGGDVSANEVKSRVDLAVQSSSQAPDSVKQALQQMYGIDQGHLTAYFLDQGRALPILQKQASAAQFGGEALARGLGLDQYNLEQMAADNVTQDQAKSGFGEIARTLPDLEAIANRFGTTFSQDEAEQDVFTQSGGTATKKRIGLASQERALFSQAAGTASGAMGPFRQAQ